MTGAAPLLMALVAVPLLVAAILAIRTAGERWGWSGEVQRKCVHVLVGLFAMALPALLPGKAPAVVLIVLALAVMLLLRRRQGPLARAGAAIHSVERRSFGDIWLAVAVGFLFLRSDGHYVFYGLPLAIITLSDAAAALAGSAYGRRRFVTEGGIKSWEGVIAFIMVGWVAAMSLLLLASDASRGNVILLGLVIAVFGAMVEAVSWRGLDNLFVPLAIHFFLRGFLDAAPLQIALVAGAFLIGTALAQAGAARVRLAPHTARAFAVALFIFLGVGGVYGAAWPVAAMAAYLVTRRLLPGGGDHPDLDFLGTLSAAAAIWLFIGETVGPNAIHFYSLAMAGMALAYLAMALQAAGKVWWGLPLAAAVWLAQAGLARAGLRMTPLPAHLDLVAAGSFALVWLASLIAAPIFRRWRAPRSAALASLVPLIGYALHASTL